MNTLDESILEELVYERVKLTVDLYELRAFEEDLDDSIRRAVERLGAAAASDGDLARRLVDSAWQRLSSDLEQLRDRHEPACALCEAQEARPDRVGATTAPGKEQRRMP